MARASGFDRTYSASSWLNLESAASWSGRPRTAVSRWNYGAAISWSGLSPAASWSDRMAVAWRSDQELAVCWSGLNPVALGYGEKVEVFRSGSHVAPLGKE